MRALFLTSVVVGGVLLVAPARGESGGATAPAAATACPTVLPVAEGERSIVVPSVAPHVEAPAQQAPHVASLPLTPEKEAAKSLLRDKLAQRDQLQREIAALRESTQTPEQIAVQVKIVEINRTKLRKLGVDWATLNDGKPTQTDLAGLLGTKPANASNPPPCISFAANVDPAVLGVMDALERKNVSRVLAAPSVVVTSGRPASLVAGSEIALPQPNGTGPRVERIGTNVDLVAVALGDNRIRLELRPSIREIDANHSPVVNGVTIPAVSVRQIDTALEMELGKTSIISGLVQQRTERTLDWLGRANDEVQEIALVLIVTPQIVR